MADCVPLLLLGSARRNSAVFFVAAAEIGGILKSDHVRNVGDGMRAFREKDVGKPQAVFRLIADRCDTHDRFEQAVSAELLAAFTG